MLLKRAIGRRDYYANPDAYQIGCARKISKLVKLPDGRYQIVLEGLSEFRVVREPRQVRIDRPKSNGVGRSSDGYRRRGDRGAAPAPVRVSSGDTASAAWKSLQEQGLSGADLVNFLCFHIDVPAIEKQTLLEARGGRLDCLFDVLTFKLEERKLKQARVARRRRRYCSRKTSLATFRFSRLGRIHCGSLWRARNRPAIIWRAGDAQIDARLAAFSQF